MRVLGVGDVRRIARHRVYESSVECVYIFDGFL
jgi:hypothetical protein